MATRWLPGPRRVHPDPAAGRELMVKLIESLSAGVPRPLVEIAKLGRTLSKRAADELAYFDRPGTSNGSPLFLGVGQRYDGNRQPVIVS